MTASTKERPSAQSAASEEAPAKGGKKKLIVILLVVLLAVGGGAYYFLSSSGKPAAPQPGIVEALDPVAVNLAGGGYLKVGVALQLTADVADADKPDGSKAIDLIISTFSGAAPADVTGAREALKVALQKKIVDAYKKDGKDVVMGIYYTDYVTQ